MTFSFVSNKFSEGFKICKCLCFYVLLMVNGIWLEFQALRVGTVRHVLATQGPVGSFVLQGKGKGKGHPITDPEGPTEGVEV
jgi:hypothetical protein